MHPRSALRVILVLMSLSARAQCPPGNIYINTQAEANAFAVSYPTCTALAGSLSISGPDITDLSPFDGIERIAGMLELDQLPLTTIDAFNSLTVVQQLWIWQCSSLVSINGFTALDTVEGSLAIFQNNALASLNAFPDLEVCGGGLLIAENAVLGHLGGFAELDSVGGLSFSFDPMLTDISAFDHPMAIGGFLEFAGNASLSVCNVASICTRLLDQSNISAVLIEGNAPGCADRDEVEASCISTGLADHSPTEVLLFPSPTTGRLLIHGSVRTGTIIPVSDLSGRSVLAPALIDGAIDTSSLPPGLYCAQIRVGASQRHLRFVRE